MRSKTRRPILALIGFCAGLSPASLRAGFLAVEGLAPDQVLQRADDLAGAEARLSGRCSPGAAVVRLAALRQGLALEGLEGVEADVGGDGGWSLTVTLPVGGPYEVRLEALDGRAQLLETRALPGVMVGDLWVLAGQSNMEGVALLEGAETPDGRVHVFDMADRWDLAEEPLHNRAESVYPVYWNVRNPEQGARREGEAARRARESRTRGAGLGLAFAKRLAAETDVPIGLIPCAYGGTSMDQWSPALRERGSHALYGAMLDRIAAAGGRVRGVLWYQGESDATPAAASAYEGKFQAFIEALRRDLDRPDLPFYYVQLGRFVTETGSAEGWNVVREAQRRLESRLSNVGVVAAVDLSLDDLIHVDTEGQKTLGRRLAALAGADLFGDRPAFTGLERGPRVGGVTFEGGDRRRARVEFEQVNGRLRTEGRLSGFSCDAESGGAPQPFKAFIDPARPTSVVLLFPSELPPGARLWYGRGLDPYCNLTDEAGMGALAFGPWPLP